MKPTVLVTGAAGFLGTECVRQLKQTGRHRVLTTDLNGAVELTGNLADAGFVKTLPDVDAVLHCAAVQYVSTSLPLLRRGPYFEINNVVATAALSERYAGRGIHMVNIGTSMMYRQDGSAIYRIDSAMEGQGVYSASKLRAWRSLVQAFPDSATIVPCIIGGPGREGLFRGFVESIRRRGMAVVPGSGTHPTHMVHVRDVASLAVRVIEARARGLFNAAAPGPLAIVDWVRLVADQLGLPAPRIVHLPLMPIHALSAAVGYRLLAREQLLMLARPHVLDIAESLAVGWQPQFDNERIVRDIATHIAGADRAVGIDPA